MDTIENLNRGEQAFKESEEYGWGIAEGTVPENMGPVMSGLMQRGVKLRFLLPENRLQADTDSPVVLKNLEMRTLIDIPALVVLTEKEGGVCFRQVGGKVDYAGFFGKDPKFHNWVKDLFLYYWDKGKRA